MENTNKCIKTKIVRHRIKSQSKSTFNFKYNTNQVGFVSQYKYLLVIMDEHLDFKTVASVLLGSRCRALGSVYIKLKKLQCLGYYTYTMMYHNGVTPILD